MKKFSTAALFLALASASGSLLAAEAKTPDARCAFLSNAPDTHTVVRGDTLWDISGKFLQNPWCWPQVWGMNREQIRDPHWIYPGQVIYLDRAAGRLRIGSAADGAGGLRTVRMSPKVRSETLDQQAVPAIPANLIEPFLSKPLVLAEDELKDAPRIVAAQEERVVLGKNDKAYVHGDLKDAKVFQAFRPGAPLRDPVTREVLGHEAIYLGALKLDRPGTSANEAHTFTVVDAKQEMGIGDLLVPMPATPILGYVPHAPEKPVDARIMSIYGGVSQAGQNQVVTVNRGRSHGIDTGTVLDLYRFGGSIVDPADKSASWFSDKKVINLPDTRYGNLFVFRVFDKISYGLVMQVSDRVQVGDIAKSPE
jgi:hypothetical protein